MTTNQQLSLLFDPEQTVGLKSRLEWKLEYGEPTPTTQFFCINPMVPSKPAAMTTDNLARIQNFLIEFDKGSLKAQARTYEEQLGLPFTTKVHSGGKSIHYVVHFARPITLEEFQYLARLVAMAVPGVDKLSCKNPNRLSRLAGIVRPDTGKQQTLLAWSAAPVKYEDFVKQLQLARPAAALRLERALVIEALRSEQIVAGSDGARRYTPTQTIEYVRREHGGRGRHEQLLITAGLMAQDGYTRGEIEPTLYEMQDLLGLDRDDVPGILRWLERRA